MDGTDDNMLWNDSEEDWDVGSECEKYDGTDKMKTVTLLGKGR